MPLFMRIVSNRLGFLHNFTTFLFNKFFINVLLLVIQCFNTIHEFSIVFKSIDCFSLELACSGRHRCMKQKKTPKCVTASVLILSYLSMN